MTSHNLEARNQLVSWQVPPAEFEIVNYDKSMIEYRKHVQDFIAPVPKKSLKKKTFVTISTNVLCADVASSKDDIDPIDRDIYLPLEISLTKWSMSEANRLIDERTHETRSWIIDPGSPPKGCMNAALSHLDKHKVQFTRLESEEDTVVDRDLHKIMKEINSFLTPDRIVFSIELKHCRQDLGSLKWLNMMTGYKTKPIKAYSLEDLYVVLIRTLVGRDEVNKSVGQGLARHRLQSAGTLCLDLGIQCTYHRNMARSDSTTETPNCARAITQSYTNILLDDVKLYSEMFELDQQSTSQLNSIKF